MTDGRVERRLSAIFAGDVAGYRRLMGADEEGTLARLNAHRREFLELNIAEHRGRIVNMAGFLGWIDEPIPIAMERMGEAARRAVAADDYDAMAHAAFGIYELFTNRHDDAIRRLKRAIELDPNSSFARGYLGIAFMFGGEPDRALPALDEAKRLSPRDHQMVLWQTSSAWAHLNAGRFAEAMDCAKRGIEVNPNFPDTHGVLAVAAAHLGHMADARAGLDGYVRLLPG
jgi:tetratricopeptide (TPR) repeat protein